jgi:ribonuclease HII
VAVAAFKPDTPRVDGVKDSKKLTPRKREELVEPLLKAAHFVGFGWVSPGYIDEHGMTAAWHAAALDALEHAPTNEMHLIVDGRDEVRGYNGMQSAMEKADDLYYPVSAASVLAKVARDMDMVRMDEHYPGYLWNQNAGYGTRDHKEAIFELGLTPYHRRSFLKKVFARAGLKME